jgi:hypothetical protein
MHTDVSAIDRIVHDADALRNALVDASGSVHPLNVASGGTTVQAALIALRSTIEAFLLSDDPDNEITGDQSTE